MAVYLGLNEVDVFGGQPSGGCNDLIVTVSWDEDEAQWIPDVSFSDIQSAYNDGKTITVQVDVPSGDASADGEWLPGDDFFVYWVRVYDDSSGIDTIKEYAYQYDSNGVAETDYYYYQVSALQTKSVTYNSSGTSQYDTVTYDAGYNGLQEVDITINAAPVASPTISIGDTGFYTDGVRKWRGRGIASFDDGEQVGWFDTTTTGSYFTYNAVQSGTTITPTESAQTVGGANYMMEGAVTVSAIPSNYIGSGVTQRTSSDLSASGATVTAPSGYYANNATYTVASGTAGTPTATKGAVNNHSITVTPSVTNTTGYITGGTLTGTGVTVSASEVVSGTLNVTSSGTKDVTNYASASIPAGTEGTPTATKSAVNNHSLTVTPSVTNSGGYITGTTKTGTAVTVTASELVSGSETKTSNGTYDVTNLAELVVNVSGGGGSGMVVATASKTLTSASNSITFTGLSGDPTSFAVVSASDLATGASPWKTAAVVFDGTDLHGQTITNTSNAQVSYDGSGFSKTYSSGSLTITGTGTNFQANEYKLVYSYGGSSANIGTSDVQVGSGATSITFTGLSDEPDYFSCIFKSNFATSSGYQRVITVVYDGTDVYGMEMDSSAHYSSAHWSYSYNAGSLTITSSGTNAGGYFHQPGYYQLTYGYGGEAPSITTEPLTVTSNGTYTAPTGKAYTPVTVNVSGGGGVHVDTKTITNSSNTETSISFTGLSGEPEAFFVRCATQMQSSSTTYYYVSNMRYNGTNVNGNAFRMGSTRQVTVVTSGYSYSYTGTTLTVSSSGSRTTAPGSFYNGTYELTYVY